MKKLPLKTQGLLDMSAITWAGLLAGEDKEYGRKLPNQEGKQGRDGQVRMEQINSAGYGYENAMSHVKSFMDRHSLVPRDLILVLDGKDAKRLRRAMYPEYKAGRDHHPEQKVQFDECLRMVKEQLLAVGASAVQQDFREADDVLAYLGLALTRAGVKVVIDTIDNDLAAVIDPPLLNVDVGGNINYNKYGLWAPKHITLYKALVGDTSDNIPGAYKFGEKSFAKLYAQFDDDGLDMLRELFDTHTLDRLEEDVADAPYLKPVLADLQGAYTSFDLARLMPEKVNTGRTSLIWEVGMVKPLKTGWTDDRLTEYAGRSVLVHAGNFDRAYASAKARVAETAWTALDIETDTPEESKEWVAEKNRAFDKEDGAGGVDVFGSELVSLGLTFGANGQYTVYLTHDHLPAEGVENLSSEQVRAFVELFVGDERPCVIQNTLFELPVLHREWGAAWENNGWHGFIPNVLDTVIEASYVNENRPAGLKQSSLHYLGYQQATYQETTQGRGMRELTAAEAFGYGADDPICTAALHQHYARIMLIEETWDAYEQVEIFPLYLTAQAYNQGQRWSLERLLGMEKHDLATRETCWAKLRDYLIERGWEGTVCPHFEGKLTPAQIKEAYLIVTKDELKTQVRTPAKFPALIRQAGYDDLAVAMEEAVEGDCGFLNTMVKSRFTGEPELNFDSPKQVAKLLYEVLALPIRLRNRPTDAMRKALPALKTALREAKHTGDPHAIAAAEEGILTASKGNPRTDDLAVLFALKYDAPTRPEIVDVLKAYQVIRTTDTKSKMFYRPYRYVRHWKDGLVRPSYRQSATVTRRHTCGDPNQQQQPKHEKHGEIPLIRSVVLPHHDDAVVISIDFSGQELRVIADYSRDQNMLDCFVGEHKKDMHSLTASGIVARANPKSLWELMCPDVAPEGSLYEEVSARWSKMTYDLFTEIRKDKSKPDSKLFDKFMRPLGKKCNFTTEYGAMAPKLAETLLVSVEEAQSYIDAKEAAFPGSAAWKKEVIEEAGRQGYVTTKLGARRHLAEALYGGDGYARSQAERQAVNFKVQSSSAEMTKLAMGRCWTSGLPWKYDCRFYGPVHDELVWSVHKDHVALFMQDLNALMVEPYADMTVPIIASMSLGPDFKNQIEVGDEWGAETEANIQKALGKLFPEALAA